MSESEAKPWSRSAEEECLSKAQLRALEKVYKFLKDAQRKYFPDFTMVDVRACLRGTGYEGLGEYFLARLEHAKLIENLSGTSWGNARGRVKLS